MKNKNGSGRNGDPVGTIKIRRRRNRGNVPNAFIKVAERRWIPLCHYVWIKANGSLPRGMIIHHEDRNTLNNNLSNLKLLSRASHLEEHRHEFDMEKRAASMAKTRKKNPWSTKSKTKITGRHPNKCDCPLHR